MKKLIYLLSSLLIIISVNIMFAQTNTPLGEVKGLVIGLSNIAFNVVSLLNIVALIAYMWIVIQFLRKRAKGDTAGLDQLKGMLLWGAVGMFFLVAVWGLTYFISTTTGIKVGGCTQLPAAPGQLVDNSKCNNSVSSFVYNGNTESSGSPSIARPPQTSTSQSYPGSQTGSGQPNNTSGNTFGGIRPNDVIYSGTVYCDGTQTSTTCTDKNNGKICTNGARSVAANGDVLYCNSGQKGEPCTRGSCVSGQCVNEITGEPVEGTKGLDQYGVCN